MHTGHSVYSTVHANNSDEVITRLTNPPINIPKPMLSALSLIVVQNRNRRTGKRRTLQIAEIMPNGDPNVLLQLNIHDDILDKVNDSETMIGRLQLYTGMTPKEIDYDLKQKMKILKWMVDNNIEDVHEVGLVMSKYYLGKLNVQ